MIEPALVPLGALNGVDVGLSVSESLDLAVLGLVPRHAEMALGELSRAVVVAGGRLTYGGRLVPPGYTQVLVDEIQRYGTHRLSLTLCLALAEQLSLSVAELDAVDRALGTWGRLLTLGADGEPVDWRLFHRPTEPLGEEARVASYSTLRRQLQNRTHARVLVGGKLRGWKGAMPGVVEEAILAVEAGTPLYLAAGFGGASAAVARHLHPDAVGWLPDGRPIGENDPQVRSALEQFRQAVESHSPAPDGLSDAERAVLLTSHRPGDIASLVVLGLSRVHGQPSAPTPST